MKRAFLTSLFMLATLSLVGCGDKTAPTTLGTGTGSPGKAGASGETISVPK